MEINGGNQSITELRKQREEQKKKKMEFLDKLAKSGIDFDKASELLGL